MISVHDSSAPFRIFSSEFSFNTGLELINIKNIDDNRVLGEGEPDIAGVGVPSHIDGIFFS